MNVNLPFPREDYILLKWPTLFLAIAIIAGASLYGGATYFRNVGARAMQVSLANLESMKEMVRQAEEEEKTIRLYIDRFMKLSEDGIIGEEDRLEMVEAIGNIRNHYNLYPMQLEIEQQATVPLAPEWAPAPPGEGFVLQVSRIKLGLSLLHEKDLSRLLDKIQVLEKGIFLIENCSIKKTNPIPQEKDLELKEYLYASCHILWTTFDKKKQSEEESVEY